MGGSGRRGGVTANATRVEWIRARLWMLQLVVGVFLVAFGAWTGRRHFALIVNGARAEGRIIGFREVRMQQSQRSWLGTSAEMPFVEFRVGEKTYRFQDWLAGRRGEGLGDAVPVLYDRERPTVAMIDRAVMNWVPWGGFAVVGVFLLAIGSIAAVSRVRRGR